MENPNLEATAGDILWGEKNRNIKNIKNHFMIYLGPYLGDNQLFSGGMLTSSSRYKNNIPLTRKHFEEYSSQGKKWRIPNKPSLIVNHLYFKRVEWAPFTLYGRLSAAGLEFVRHQLEGKIPMFFPYNAEFGY